ncbi:MAG: hypothetical protein RIM72_05595 [Alphaproteobacteria bacterium]
MTPFRLFTVLAAMAISLAACDEGTPRVVTVSSNTEKPSIYLRETAVTGLIRVLLAPEAVANASGYVDETIAVMEKSVRQAHPVFQPVDTFETGQGLMVVLFVGAPKGMSGRSLCRGELDGDSVRADGEVKIIAAMCKRNDLVGEVHGWIDEAVAVGDRDYGKVIEQMTIAMFADQGQHR